MSGNPNRHKFPFAVQANVSGGPSGGVCGGNFIAGDGDPNGSCIGWRGDLYMRRDGGTNTTMYVKESGDGTLTGWTPK